MDSTFKTMIFAAVDHYHFVEDHQDCSIHEDISEIWGHRSRSWSNILGYVIIDRFYLASLNARNIDLNLGSISRLLFFFFSTFQ
jgi:hypothetical protein